MNIQPKNIKTPEHKQPQRIVSFNNLKHKHNSEAKQIRPRKFNNIHKKIPNQTQKIPENKTEFLQIRTFIRKRSFWESEFMFTCFNRKIGGDKEHKQSEFEAKIKARKNFVGNEHYEKNKQMSICRKNIRNLRNREALLHCDGVHMCGGFVILHKKAYEVARTNSKIHI